MCVCVLYLACSFGLNSSCIRFSMKQLMVFNTNFNFCTNRWSEKFIAISWTQQNERLFLHHKFGPGRSLSYPSCWKVFKVCKKLVNCLSYDMYWLINFIHFPDCNNQKDFLYLKLFFYILDLFLELQNLSVWRILNVHWAGLITCLTLGSFWQLLTMVIWHLLNNVHSSDQRVYCP